ncbi:MAG TPA: M20/M25/M40 family metallo-hydrolase [Pyrinomonadaceae bacterium]
MKKIVPSQLRPVALLLLTLTLSVLAQQPLTTTAPSAERLREHVAYLASDALEGRRTGSPGATAAANYIAEEFSKLGLLPINPAPPKSKKDLSRFMQPFPYIAGVKLGAGNKMNATTGTLQIGDDWMPLGFTTNGQVEAPLIFVGFGITAAELNYNDFSGADISGKVAIALSGTPDGDNPHGQFGRYEDVRWKAIAARTAGAKALVVIVRDESFKEDRLSRLRYDNSSGDAGLPVVAVSRQWAQRLLGSPVTDLEQAARSKEFSSSKKTASGSISIATDVIRNEVQAANVIGKLEGSDANLKKEVIVLGAHYDHLGRGGEGSLAPREGDIHHGADDNASGVAGVLELARIFSAQQPQLRRTIIFMAFCGEEEGLLGSNYYVNHPVVPLANTIAMINMDMIGRLRNKNVIIGGVGTASEWRALIDSANVAQAMTVAANGSAAETTTAPARFPVVISENGRAIVTNDATKQFLLTLSEDGYGPSDHSSFYSKQIPVLFFWTGTHEDYHKPSDTADKINYIDEAAILALVGRIVNEMDVAKRPTFTVAKSESTGRSTGFRVYLGTIPNYADSNDGLLLDGVRDDSPAAKAGLKAGDRIVKLAGRDVHNVYDYTYALGEMKAGEEYEVELVRGTERLKLKITPAARK